MQQEKEQEEGCRRPQEWSTGQKGWGRLSSQTSLLWVYLRLVVSLLGPLSFGSVCSSYPSLLPASPLLFPPRAEGTCQAQDAKYRIGGR